MMTRGSKTAAEKVVRESESGPDMGSPDRRESIPPVTDMHDSPLFKFLCELSPIQPAKSVHHAQTYNELTFPQEHRVFASPRSATRRSSTSALKRCVAAERVSAQGEAEGRENVGWQDGGTMSRSTVCGSPSPLNRRSGDRQVASCSRRQGDEAGATQDMDVKMKASGDDVYMGEQPGGEAMGAMSSGQLDPECTSSEMNGIRGSGGRFEAEFADYSPLESGVSAAMASEMVRCSDDQGARVGGARGEVSDAGERRLSTSSLVSHVIDCVVPGNLSQESRCPDGEELRRLSMGCNSGIEGHELRFSPVAKGSPELDRETAAMVYLLAGNQDVGPGNEEWSENSSEVVVPRLPLRGASGYCDQERDLKNGSMRREEGEMVDAITPQSGHVTCSEEGHDPGTVITAQEVGQQQGLLPNRGESSGQRGIRRRCLDFDASLRRKSLGSISGRKAMGSRLKDCSGSSVGGDSDADCVVGDVVPAAPDGSSGRVQVRLSNFTNSNDFSRAESDSGTHARGASRCGDSLAAMRRVQFTSGPYQKSEDGPQPHRGELQTPTSQKCGTAGAAVPAAGLRRSPRVRPRGIGLHLNSLTSAAPLKREYPPSGMESSKGVLATVLGLQPVVCASEKENPCGEGLGSEGYGGVVDQSFNPGVRSVLERRGEMEMSGVDGASMMNNNRVSIPAPDFRCLNLESLSALEESLSLTPGANLPRVVSPRGQKRSQGHQEELMRAAQAEGEAMGDILDSPRSLKRRRLSRRKSNATTQSDKSGEGCKRCTCKKTKCLKLYCECFAAGVYCVGTCACRDCFNKPEYEETVINTRHQIETRNPLAFAPKIVQTAESSPAPGDEALDTPASARHKRGCNCKKSLCLKKYCECYQAGVGCSEGCRCEGCKNMYGRKEGPEGDEKEGEQANNIREESPAEDPIELLNRMSGKSDRLRDSAKSNLSPITPTFENDGHGRPMLRLRSMGRRRGSTSDEHSGSPLAEAAARPPTSPTRFSQTLDGFHLVPYPPQGDTDFSMSGAGESPMTTPTFARMKHVTPQWEGLNDLCTLTPLPLVQPRPTPGSSCITVERPGTSPAFSSHITESPYHAGSSTSVHQRVASRHWSPRDDSPSQFRQPAPRSPLRFDTPRQSQLSDQCHSTAPTPSVPQQTPLLLSGRNLQSELESAKRAADDDGTPEFLKHGDESFGSPTRTTVTKSNSPKQKRVTPPRYAAYREPASSRGGGGNLAQSSLARRFILQALPAPPSRTPSYPNG